ncbi:unnamed protein product [Adineta ricciae]|uniref:G-protein coupled receptors family 1 profile domain-containing protein n=1 Tax=Adineta ricciae TaxID=249248 RepID=A0A815VE45_ADIRI|nr:unnamed protein product [Adineta ricciae]CAF1576382.1 unnamed protein product [Adineta ricciae]
MSSSTNILATMQLVQKYLYQFGGPVLIFIGTIGCILNLIVFSQKNLRKSPCSIYFIAHNYANFVFIYFSLLFATLSLGYGIDISTKHIVICRIRLYITILSNVLSPFYLVFASIDRVVITSQNALTRRRSTRRIACICIAIGTLFWTLLHTLILVFANIIQIGPNAFICYFQLSVYVSFLSYYSLFRAITVLSLMIICGIWSIKNVRHLQQVRPAASLSATVATDQHSHSSKDRQLFFILLIDIVIYALFSFAFAFYLIYQQITQNDIKNAGRTQIETISSNLCQFSGTIPFCISFYGNFIISKTFRNEVKKILSCQQCFRLH